LTTSHILSKRLSLAAERHRHAVLYQEFGRTYYWDEGPADYSLIPSNVVTLTGALAIPWMRFRLLPHSLAHNSAAPIWIVSACCEPAAVSIAISAGTSRSAISQKWIRYRIDVQPSNDTS
jgi:hypothetical protein